MSGLVWTQSDSGLIVGNHASGEAAVRRALAQYDPDLRLVPPGIFIRGEHEDRSDAWRVYRYVGSGRDVQFVCGWWDDYGNPYPQLSVDGLLQMVQRLDRNSRGWERRDADAENAALVEQRRREAREELDEIAREFKGRLEGKRSSPLPRSRSLQLARMRQRARNPSLYDA